MVGSFFENLVIIKMSVVEESLLLPSCRPALSALTVLLLSPPEQARERTRDAE